MRLERCLALLIIVILVALIAGFLSLSPGLEKGSPQWVANQRGLARAQITGKEANGALEVFAKKKDGTKVRFLISPKRVCFVLIYEDVKRPFANLLYAEEEEPGCQELSDQDLINQYLYCAEVHIEAPTP